MLYESHLQAMTAFKYHVSCNKIMCGAHFMTHQQYECGAQNDGLLLLEVFLLSAICGTTTTPNTHINEWDWNENGSIHRWHNTQHLAHEMKFGMSSEFQT